MQKNKKQNGQSLIESLVVISILLLTAYGSIEIMRILAFKSVLHTVTSYLSHQIAYNQLAFIREKDIPEKENSILTKSKIKDDAAQQINHQLNSLYSSQISLDANRKSDNSILFIKEHMTALSIHIVNSSHHTQSLPAGVYINAHACLPVLFSSYFKITPAKETKIGVKSDDEENRNCLGLYSNNVFSPLFWFQIRSASYSPWPASSEIFQHGLGIPQEVPGLKTSHRQKTIEKILSMDLLPYFNSRTRNEE